MATAEDRQPVDDVVVVLCAPLAPAQAQQHYDRVEGLLSFGGAPKLTCEIRGRVDLSIVEALARLLLIAQRFDAGLDVRSAGSDREDLEALLALTGLEVVSSALLEPWRQTETVE